MKVIDIYNKIANGEKVPNFIIDEQEYYIGADGVLKSFFGDEVEWCVYKNWLNEEVQIKEEVEDKEYEDITEWEKEAIKDIKTNSKYKFGGLENYVSVLAKTQNELIRNQKKIIERLNK